MQRLCAFLSHHLFFLGVLIFTSTFVAREIRATPTNQCVTCHQNIEDIRDRSSDMMKAILQKATEAGHAGNDCIICHGGDPNTKEHVKAHRGTVDYFKKHDGPKDFYPDPGSPWINNHTCGLCHMDLVNTQRQSLMFTEAGKIQGTQWGFGAPNGYQHNWANYDIEQTPDEQKLGTEDYHTYMKRLEKAEPQVFPKKMVQTPPAPTAEAVHEKPSLAMHTYIRMECQRCHTGVKGQEREGQYRGMGCTSCHVPYSTGGLYEGRDPMIPKDEPGHMLTHQIQGTREAQVHVGEQSYSGIPVRSCVTCHNRGRRIGTSYMGLMETAYSSPFMGGGDVQPKTFGKKYLHLHADLHKDKGMLCQDCHTSIDVHSDGRLAGSTLAAVEIECQDCHGTPTAYPWELPLGTGDEISGPVPAVGEARGVSGSLPEYLKKGTVFDKEDGYLISARGNPMPHLVRRGDDVVLHSAGGQDLLLKPLKKLLETDALSEEARVAMVGVQGHMNQMECYACHDAWAPQCYGCHIQVDYSKEQQGLDWISIGEDHDAMGRTAEVQAKIDVNALDEHKIDGHVQEERSYLRFEDPPLAVNGEHRVAPSIPGCQTSITVIGKNGETLLKNHIFKIPNVEGAGPEGQKGIDMAVSHTHTVSLKGRSCESCHANEKAMGYGIAGGELFEDPSKGYGIELTDSQGNPIPKQAREQIQPMDGLDHDWSRFVTETGEQLQTVGHHFTGSRPLNNAERSRLDRRGVCISCHQEMPDHDLAVSMMVHIKEVGGFKIDNTYHKNILNKTIRLTAWVQVLGILILVCFIIWALLRFRRSYRLTD